MKKSTKKKIAKFIVRDLIKFKLTIPVWFLAGILLLPLIAYTDLILFEGAGFLTYLLASFLEIWLVYVGFSISSTTFKIKKSK